RRAGGDVSSARGGLGGGTLWPVSAAERSAGAVGREGRRRWRCAGPAGWRAVSGRAGGSAVGRVPAAERADPARAGGGWVALGGTGLASATGAGLASTGGGSASAAEAGSGRAGAAGAPPAGGGGGG